MRFLTELRCEKLRSEFFRLTEHLDYEAPTATDIATQSPSSRVASAQVAKRRATEPQNKTDWSASSRNLQPRRQGNRWAAPSLPPILLALFGEQPRNSTAFRRARASGAPGGGGPSGGGAPGGVASAASTGGGSGGGSGGSGGGRRRWIRRGRIGRRRIRRRRIGRRRIGWRRIGRRRIRRWRRRRIGWRRIGWRQRGSLMPVMRRLFEETPHAAR